MSSRIEITGTPEITKEYFDFKTGLKAFWDVEINKVIGETGGMKINQDKPFTLECPFTKEGYKFSGTDVRILKAPFVGGRL